LIGSAGSDAEAAPIARDYHALLWQHGVTAIFWSENMVPEAVELRAFRSQVRVVQVLLRDGCVSRAAEHGAYKLLVIKPACNPLG
jgi:hypothetical protein